MFWKQTHVTKKFLPVFLRSKTTLNRQQQHDAYQLTRISAAKCSSEILSADGLVSTDRPASLTADHMAIVQWETCCAWTKAPTTGDICRQGPDHSANVHFRPPSLCYRIKLCIETSARTPSNSFQVFTLHNSSFFKAQCFGSWFYFLLQVTWYSKDLRNIGLVLLWGPT